MSVFGRINLGRIDFRLSRVQGHFAKVQWLMLAYLTLDSLKRRYGVSFWWILLIFPIVAFIWWLDKKHIYPQSADASILAAPFNQRLVVKLDKILKILEEK